MYSIRLTLVLIIALVGAPDRKRPVTISGCAREGTTKGSFMLMNVHELTAGDGGHSGDCGHQLPANARDL